MKMKKRDEWWKAVAGLAVLAVVAVGLGLLFRGQRPTPGATEPTATGTPTPTMTPAPTATPPPEGTPPPRHLSAAVEVQVPEGFLRLVGLDGDTAAILIKVDGETQVAIWNLTTREVKQISSATDTYAKYPVCISDRWVAWSERAELADHSIDRRLKVYDRNQEREFELEADPEELDLSDSVVVWENWGGENDWDVLAYDLKTRTTVTVAERPGAQIFPRISGSWVIYLESREDSGESGQVDLRAHSLETGEDFLLDQACVLGSDGTGIHAISEGRVVWTQCTQTETDWEFRLLGIDLNGPRDEYFVNLSVWFSFEEFFGNILAHRVSSGMGLYDLGRKEPMETVDALQAHVGALFISGNQVVWERTDIDRLYMAWIER